MIMAAFLSILAFSRLAIGLCSAHTIDATIDDSIVKEHTINQEMF